MRRVLLRFDDEELERGFRRAHDTTSLGAVRLSALVGMVLFLSFGILDARLVPEDAGELLVIRLGVALYLALAIALTYAPWFPRIQQAVACSGILVACCATAAMPLFAPLPEGWGAMGSMLILIFLFAFIRARIVPAAITAGIAVAFYELTLVLIDTPAATALYLTFEVSGFVVGGLFACHTLERLWRRDFLRGLELERERERSDALLHNVLPETIARRLRADAAAIAESVEEASVLFADIVGFTPLTERTDGATLVRFLDRLFARFDALCDAHGAEKIKTIGDGYMAVTGVPDPHPDPAGAIAALALDMRAAVGEVRLDGVGPLAVRIGICTGPVLAGVIGRRKFAYDLWGDTVNTASRLEMHGRPGRIHVCDRTRSLLGARYALDGPEQVDLKGKGTTSRWELIGAVPARALAVARDGERTSTCTP